MSCTVKTEDKYIVVDYDNIINSANKILSTGKTYSATCKVTVENATVSVDKIIISGNFDMEKWTHLSKFYTHRLNATKTIKNKTLTMVNH